MFLNQVNSHDLFNGNPGQHFLGLSASGGITNSVFSTSRSSNKDNSQQSGSQDLFSQTQKTDASELESNSNFQKYICQKSIFGKTEKLAGKLYLPKSLSVYEKTDKEAPSQQIMENDQMIISCAEKFTLNSTFRNVLYGIHELVSSLTNDVKVLKETLTIITKKEDECITSGKECVEGIKQLYGKIKEFRQFFEEYEKKITDICDATEKCKKTLKNDLKALEETVKSRDTNVVNNLEKIYEHHEILNKEVLSEIQSQTDCKVREIKTHLNDKCSQLCHTFTRKLEASNRKFDEEIKNLKSFIKISLQQQNYDKMLYKNGSPLQIKVKHSNCFQECRKLPRDSVMSTSYCRHEELINHSYSAKNNSPNSYSKESCVSVLSLNKKNYSSMCKKFKNKKSHEDCKKIALKGKKNSPTNSEVVSEETVQNVSSHVLCHSMKRAKNDISSTVEAENDVYHSKEDYKGLKSAFCSPASFVKGNTITKSIGKEQENMKNLNFSSKSRKIKTEQCVNYKPDLSSCVSSPCMSVTQVKPISKCCITHVISQKAKRRKTSSCKRDVSFLESTFDQIWM